MRTRLLTTLIVASTFAAQARASGDDSCYPRWSVLKETYEACSNQAFLSPGNDSQVNLRLLLADQGVLPLAPQALNATDLQQGYGPLPFPLSRLDPPPAAEPGPQPASSPEALPGALPDPLTAALQPLGLTRPTSAAGDAFLDGEGNRCRSNTPDSANRFIGQVLASSGLSDPERKALAASRLQLLQACAWEPGQLNSLIPGQLSPGAAQAFARYLHAAGDFYSGRFEQAAQGFASLQDSPVAWLQQTGAYMLARTALNQAQQNAFNEYGELDRTAVDTAQLQQAGQGLATYLQRWPEGDYAVSARGLTRRVHWLAGDQTSLAHDYAWQLTQTDDSRRNLSRDALIDEVDVKLLMASPGALKDPMLLAVSDLMRMREQTPPGLNLADLQAQQAVFAAQPALYDYLLAAHALYVRDDAEQALRHLPAAGTPATPPSYLQLSQQVLRGLALQARQDWKGAQQTWLDLLPHVSAPLQREQLELALAMSFERDEQLSRVFASDSPIRSAQVRHILLGHAADAALLREQTTQGPDATERNLALFVLLYKDLLRGRYADFASDLQRLPAALPEQKLGYGLGYVYADGPSLALFQWQGDKAESGYACPSIAQTAATLQADARAPQALNCLGEFILRNHLDSMPLDQRRDADTLGGSAPGFTGEVFSRLDGYRQVIDNPKAASNDKAYALFRAINCYAPAGYNSCGGQEVEPAVRKAWFRQLKGSYASSQWGKTLQYYW